MQEHSLLFECTWSACLHTCFAHHYGLKCAYVCPWGWGVMQPQQITMSALILNPKPSDMIGMNLQSWRQTILWGFWVVLGEVVGLGRHCLNMSECLTKDGVSSLTLPVPGTSTPSTGLGISMLFTWPYFPHSSRTSSTISSYSSSSSSSSGTTMFMRHSTSVGMPPIWFMELFIKPGTCSVTGVWFILVWKAKRDVGGGVNVRMRKGLGEKAHWEDLGLDLRVRTDRRTQNEIHSSHTWASSTSSQTDISGNANAGSRPSLPVTLTRVAFLEPTLALCTKSFLSPSCMPFSPAMA